MTFTYTPGSGSDLDRIRAAIGDTEASAPPAERLEDEEIADLLTLRGAWRKAAPAAARALAAKLTALPSSKAVGATSIVQRRVEQLLAIAVSLETPGRSPLVAPLVYESGPEPCSAFRRPV